MAVANTQEREAVVARVEYADERTAAFRRTLDRLPDDIALAIGLRVFDLGKTDRCVCGWAVREALARELNVEATDWAIDYSPSAIWKRDEVIDTDKACADKFGGDRWKEWRQIFDGVMNPQDAPLIEEALFDRVMAAATASTNSAVKKLKSRTPTPEHQS